MVTTDTANSAARDEGDSALRRKCLVSPCALISVFSEIFDTNDRREHATRIIAVAAAAVTALATIAALWLTLSPLTPHAAADALPGPRLPDGAIPGRAMPAAGPGGIPSVREAAGTGTMLGATPDWVVMWSLAVTIFALCKAATYVAAGDVRRHASLRRRLGYLFAWPGLNARTFLRRPAGAFDRPTAREWLFAAARTAIGAAIVWGLLRHLPADMPLVIGWLGMAGVVLMLHFGVLHGLSLTWRAVGVDAPPLMRKPTRATSVSDFWSRRWNTAFRDLSRDLILMPLRRRLPLTVVTMVVFAVSGVVHDMVISVPARAGFGLPTLYFLLQGAAVLIERTAPMRGSIARPVVARLWTVTVVAGPALILFHRPFVDRVVLPMFGALGAI